MNSVRLGTVVALLVLASMSQSNAQTPPALSLETLSVDLSMPQPFPGSSLQGYFDSDHIYPWAGLDSMTITSAYQLELPDLVGLSGVSIFAAATTAQQRSIYG